MPGIPSAIDPTEDGRSLSPIVRRCTEPEATVGAAPQQRTLSSSMRVHVCHFPALIAAPAPEPRSTGPIEPGVSLSPIDVDRLP